MIPPLHCENPLEHEGHEWIDDGEPVWCDGEVDTDDWVDN